MPPIFDTAMKELVEQFWDIAFEAGINAEKLRRGELIPGADGKINHSVY